MHSEMSRRSVATSQSSTSPEDSWRSVASAEAYHSLPSTRPPSRAQSIRPSVNYLTTGPYIRPVDPSRTIYVSPYPLVQSGPSHILSPQVPTNRPSSRSSTRSSASATSAGAQAGEIFQVHRQALLSALDKRRLNTIGELRRAERRLADSEATEDAIVSLRDAWRHYVNSNSFLTELRTLTRTYPFSSALLDEARRLIQADPRLDPNWNYCRLVLLKIQSEELIQRFAREQAAEPAMWGLNASRAGSNGRGRPIAPSAAMVMRLGLALEEEWTRAVERMLAFW